MAESAAASTAGLELRHLRPSTAAGPFFAALSQLIGEVCRPERPSIYLLGSHLDQTAVPTSDVDLAIVFASAITTDGRKRVSDALASIQTIAPVLLDFTIFDRSEVARGLTPNLVRARLLSGPDLLGNRALRPAPALMVYYAELAMGFIQLMHTQGDSRPLALPFSPPEPADRYLGYTQIGIRTGPGQYRPGVSLLVKTVLAVASFRLALLRGIFALNKADVATRYRDTLPADPWLPLVQTLYELGRRQLNGELPSTPEQAMQLETCCRQVAAFENEFLGTLMTHLPAWLPHAEPAFLAQVTDTLGRIKSASPAIDQKLAGLRRALSESQVAGAQNSPLPERN